MRKKLNYREKYLLSISEYLSTKDIQDLLDISVIKARDIKKQAEIECVQNNISVLSSNKVPTHIVLDLIDKDTNYYYRKMQEEAKAVSYVRS